MRFTFLLLILLGFNFNCIGQHTDDIVGVWLNQEKDGKIQVYKQNGKYFGKLIWIKDNFNDDGSSPRLDALNPTDNLKSRPIEGTVILIGLEWDDDEWNNGEIYDPKTGKTYSCYAELKSDKELFFKGYIGFSLIGRSTIWTRID